MFTVKYTETVVEISHMGFPIQLVPIICTFVTYFTYWDWRRVFWVSWKALDLGGGELVSWAAAAEALRIMKTVSCCNWPPGFWIWIHNSVIMGLDPRVWLIRM
jgi:hypothetical protein